MIHSKPLQDEQDLCIYNYIDEFLRDPEGAVNLLKGIVEFI